MILFHVLDEAEVRFPFDGMVELEEPEGHERLALDAASFPPRLSCRGRRIPPDLPPRMLSGGR